MEYKANQCVAFRLRRLSRIVDKQIRQTLADVDITENQMGILFALNVMGKVDQGFIGKQLVLERSTVSRGIGVLQKKGYIIKTTDYQPEIEISTRGKEIVKELQPKWQSFMSGIFNNIGQKGFESILYLEKKMI